MSDTDFSKRRGRSRPRGVHGVGSGPGWGGPAKGYVHKPPRAYAAGNKAAAGNKGAFTMTSLERQRMRSERAQALEDELYRIATQGELDQVRVQAAARLHAIYEGLPVATNVNLSADDLRSRSDDDIRDELARLRGAGAEASAGAAPPPVPGKPGGVVH